MSNGRKLPASSSSPSSTAPENASCSGAILIDVLPFGRAASRFQVNQPENSKSAAELFFCGVFIAENTCAGLLLENLCTASIGRCPIGRRSKNTTYRVLTFDESTCLSLWNQGLHHCGRAIPLFFYAFRVTDKYDNHVVLA